MNKEGKPNPFIILYAPKVLSPNSRPEHELRFRLETDLGIEAFTYGIEDIFTGNKATNFWNQLHHINTILQTLELPKNNDKLTWDFPQNEAHLQDARLSWIITLFLLNQPIPHAILDKDTEIAVSRKRIKVLAKMVKEKLGK